MVPNTSDDLPDPEMPVNTVRRRFGISMLMSLRLFSRAPWTRIRSWLSAACGAGVCVAVLVDMLIESPSVGRSRHSALRRCRLSIYPASSRHYDRMVGLNLDDQVVDECPTNAPGYGEIA